MITARHSLFNALSTIATIRTNIFIPKQLFSTTTFKTKTKHTPSPSPSSFKMAFVDTHTHVDMTIEKLGSSYEDYRKLLPPEYDGCVCVVSSIKTFAATKNLTEIGDRVHGAYGVHPHEAKDFTDETEKELRECMAHPKTVALGEIGLDYHYNNSPPEVQREIFIRQLRIAVSVGKPIVIHTREAEDDTIAIMKEHVPREWHCHIHCFTSSLNLANAILDNFPNSFIGITGVVTFGSAQGVRDVVKAVPLTRLLLETDSPYMAPIPFRGKTCHSGYIPHVAAKIAEVKGVPLPEVLQVIRENTRKMYGF
eukprot:TRINITY_DN8176_c0_g1_i3.p1 TRINITY_DN8176_c0_g1~~TRINITY_DN8176_c0_g1_i3.p1  ORF type:complete len:309 (+),score=59.67 TRINITY_DN8176_c0_g1_i3:115-1041(+)